MNKIVLEGSLFLSLEGHLYFRWLIDTDDDRYDMDILSELWKNRGIEVTYENDDYYKNIAKRKHKEYRITIEEIGE